MNVALRYWSEIRALLRRHPLLDYVQAMMLLLWGLTALLHPHAVVHASHFAALGRSVGVAGVIALLAGIGQAGVARLRRPRLRTTASFIGLWVMVSLWFAVDSPTGKIAWGGHAFIQLLICLALVP